MNTRFNETDFLEYTDLNEIEEKISLLNLEMKNFVPQLEIYEEHEWKLNDFPYIQLIDHIEKAISQMSFFLFRPNGYIKDKVWLEDEFDHPVKAFDYQDINRWLNNLDLLSKNTNYEGNLWDIRSDVIWDEESNLEWEEII